MSLVSTCAGVLAVAVAACAASTFAATIVVPNAQANTLGNGQDNGDILFGSPGVNTDGNRYQQVYNAGQFATLGATENINSIAFRAKNDLSFFGDTYTISDVSIRLSTTSKDSTIDGPNGFENTFANNITSPQTVVYDGALTLLTLTGGTTDFGFVINLQTPFAYTKAMGNLLLDVTVNDGATVAENGFLGNASNFDTQTGTALGAASDDGVASAFGNSAAQTLGANSTTGLVTQFGTTLVPEPASLGALSAIGLAALARRRRA